MTEKNLLQKELKQTYSFTSRGQEAVLSLMRTTDKVKRQLSEITLPYGITPQQYNVLRILRGAGSAGLPILEIADRMIEESPGITRFVNFLEKKELIEKNTLDTDRRCQICKLTSGGHDLLARLELPMNEFHKKVMKDFSRDELVQLIDFLERIRS